MHGLIFFYEDKGLIQSVNAKKNFLADVSIQIDLLDFHTMAISQIVEFIEFNDYTSYCFVALHEYLRMLKIVEQLEKRCDCEISVVTQVGDVIVGNPREPILRAIKEIQVDEFSQNQLSPSLAISNGLRSMFTGVYPDLFPKNLIKHIYVEKLELIQHIDQSIIDYLSINSSIFIDSNEQEVVDFPSIILRKSDFETDVRSELIQYSKDEYSKMLEDLHQKGNLYNPSLARGIFDYNILSNNLLTHRLFYFSEGIYLDYQKNVKICNDLSASYFDIVSTFSTKQKASNEKTDRLSTLLPLLYNISGALKMASPTFVTPLNRYKQEALENYTSTLRYIGIQTEGSSFIYDCLEKKLFETSLLFLQFLEADMKDSFDYLKQELSEDYESTEQEYKRILYGY